MFEIKGMTALVLGLGVSGDAAARLLLARDCRVTALDQGRGPQQDQVAAELREAGAQVYTDAGELPEGTVDLCVVSPAFNLKHPWLETCRQRGIPLISELELGARCWSGKILAVTGSKGKSSLVKWCADTLNGAGVAALPAGNYGVPLSRLALDNPDVMWAVTEVSSFQMELTETFSPDIAVLLNIQADHLDRHANMEEYCALKLKIFKGMRPGGVALLSAGLAVPGCVPEGVTFWRFGTGAGCDWTYAGHKVSGMLDGQRCHVDINGTWFDNPVFGLAAAAGVAVLRAIGFSEAQITKGLANFKPLPHRMQLVLESRHGVRYVNDSKATSLTATAAALRMTGRPVRLIAGGLLKEHNSEMLKELLTETTKKGYLIGNCAEQLFKAWSDAVPCEICGTLDQAVAAAARESDAGDTVLLSPGTASFDQFKSYRERGERFMTQVRAVANL